ncbi:MAG: serine/threonine protein kinase [Planctomycetes bacterium]|nr:serine/threonine protein kinase [Planctomycetota bacterium]
MIACECQQCGKPLRVKDDLAGKKVKCPECGQAVPVPPVPPAAAGTTRSPVLSGGSKRTPVPMPAPESSDPEGPTMPPDAGRVDLEVEPSQQTLDDDSGGEPPAEYPAELTDFLAPPAGPGEIGRLGSYRVLSVLGAGGMGVVFKAEDLSLQRLVAIKAMLPSLAASASARERFKREARSAAAIKHDHIVTIHQVGEDRGAPFLAMEFLAGEPLDERLKRDQILPVADIIRIGKEVALALEAAHEVGMIHRDIKPGNIWLEAASHQRSALSHAEGKSSGKLSAEHCSLTAFRRVKILDFGLARAAGKESQLTQQGAIIGTPAYMAPEQAAGKEVDARCDLFSLGCVLYRMCTGDLPFKGTDTISTLMAVATHQPPSPRSRNPKVPAALSDLIEALLKKRPHERPESARAVQPQIQAVACRGGCQWYAGVDRCRRLVPEQECRW